MPKSHLYFQKYFEEKGITNYQRTYNVPEEDKNKEPLCYDRKLNTKAGDFILFDSRTFHCNTVPMEDNLRVCTYICMLPAKWVPEPVQEVRKKALQERRNTNHHPGDGFKTCAEIPRKVKDVEAFKALIDKINVFELDEEM